MAAPVVETDPARLFLHADLSIEPFLKHDLQLRLDTDHQLCPDHVHSPPCPRGASCPLRHVTPSPLNFQPTPPIPHSQHARTVCKHWLRGLCKKGQQCDFMHEYHLRKMPECWFFAKYGFCSNGDECMYLHVTEDMRIRECPSYRKGFCPQGASPPPPSSPHLLTPSLSCARAQQVPTASSSTCGASSARTTSSASAPRAKTARSASASLFPPPPSSSLSLPH